MIRKAFLSQQRIASGKITRTVSVLVSSQLQTRIYTHDWTACHIEARFIVNDVRVWNNMTLITWWSVFLTTPSSSSLFESTTHFRYQSIFRVLCIKCLSHDVIPLTFNKAMMMNPLHNLFAARLWRSIAEMMEFLEWWAVAGFLLNVFDECGWSHCFFP